MNDLTDTLTKVEVEPIVVGAIKDIQEEPEIISIIQDAKEDPVVAAELATNLIKCKNVEDVATSIANAQLKG